jgi:hypothetical protein
VASASHCRERGWRSRARSGTLGRGGSATQRERPTTSEEGLSLVILYLKRSSRVKDFVKKEDDPPRPRPATRCAAAGPGARDVVGEEETEREREALESGARRVLLGPSEPHSEACLLPQGTNQSALAEPQQIMVKNVSLPASLPPPLSEASTHV